MNFFKGVEQSFLKFNDLEAFSTQLTVLMKG